MPLFVEGVTHYWNCGHSVSKKARVCGHCEADLTEAPSAEEAAAVMELLEQMPPDVLGELDKVMSESATQRNLRISSWSARARAGGVSKLVTAKPIPKSMTCWSVVATSAAICGAPNAAVPFRETIPTALVWTKPNSYASRAP
jgi:hypothetical protein